jgi:putative transposase
MSNTVAAPSPKGTNYARLYVTTRGPARLAHDAASPMNAEQRLKPIGNDRGKRWSGRDQDPLTDAVLETVAEWQNRPLEPMYPLVFFDALRVKIRDEGLVRNKAVYVALGVTPEGTKDILGLWIETSEGAKFWLRVMTELKNRGVEDILIAVVDGLKGFPEAIAAVFPPTIVQTCIVHLIRNSMDFASWKDRKPIAAELKAIYRATDADVARRALEDFDAGVCGRKYPAIAQSWRRNWEHVIPFFAFPVAVRRIIYTTNAIESLNAKLRRAVRTRGHFPTDEAAIKLLYLVLRQVAQTWKMPPREWCEAKTQFAIMFDDRFVRA